MLEKITILIDEFYVVVGQNNFSFWTMAIFYDIPEINRFISFPQIFFSCLGQGLPLFVH
jgi:hypothetical protein